MEYYCLYSINIWSVKNITELICCLYNITLSSIDIILIVKNKHRISSTCTIFHSNKDAKESKKKKCQKIVIRIKQLFREILHINSIDAGLSSFTGIQISLIVSIKRSKEFQFYTNKLEHSFRFCFTSKKFHFHFNFFSKTNANFCYQFSHHLFVSCVCGF